MTPTTPRHERNVLRQLFREIPRRIREIGEAIGLLKKAPRPASPKKYRFVDPAPYVRPELMAFIGNSPMRAVVLGEVHLGFLRFVKNDQLSYIQVMLDWKDGRRVASRHIAYRADTHAFTIELKAEILAVMRQIHPTIEAEDLDLAIG